MVRKNRKHGRTTRVASTRQLTINFVHASLVLPIQGNPVLKDLLDLQHFRQQVERQAELDTGIQAACLDWTEVVVTPPCKNMLFDGWENAAEDTSTPPRVIIGLKGPTTSPLNVDQTPPPRSAPTKPERALTMEGGMNNDRVSALVAEVNVLVKESKAIIATQNDTINELKANMAAQDDTINELKANMAAQNDSINVMKANMAAQNDKIIAQDDTINELKANMAAQNDKIIAQDDTINELKASMAAQDDTINVLKANMAARYLSRSATIEKLEAKILAQGGIIKTLEAANMDVRRQHTLDIDKLNTRLTESNEELAEKLTAHSAEIEKLQNDNKEQQKCIRVLMLTFATSSA